MLYAPCKKNITFEVLWYKMSNYKTKPSYVNKNNLSLKFKPRLYNNLWLIKFLL